MMDEEKVARFPVVLRRYRFDDEMKIRRRPWIMRGLLLRKQITSMVAQGGVGKSIFGLTIALHLCAGRPFGPFSALDRYKVAILSVEEDEDELARRLHAVRRQFDFNNDDAARLFTINCADDPVIAQADRRGVVRTTRVAEEMERVLAREVIDVVIVDPFIEVWNGMENDNGQVRAAAGVIRSMIRRLNAACLLMHHVKKGIVTPGDIDASRGASSLSGLVRIGHTITNMTAADANNFNLSSHKGIVRIDASKGNYFPAAEDAHWFKFKNVVLDNADDIAGISGDHVGVLLPWEPPGLFEGVSYERIDAILDRISDGLPGGERYTFAGQSKERWCGQVIVDVCECAEEKATRIIKVWKQSGLLYEKDYMSAANRNRQRKGVYVDAEKRPSSTTETG